MLEELAKGLDYVNELRSRATSARNQKIPQHLGKSEEDVVRDYLSHLADQWYEMMQVGAQTLNVVPLDIVITHPAVSHKFYMFNMEANTNCNLVMVFCGLAQDL